MKIEKVNDHQIRCTLTKADLADRELKISELAYGTEKAKSLFRDMMQQASAKFGFEADDIPLMIEAIPLNADCIVLVITKVEDPEELDTRFSKFAPAMEDDDEIDPDERFEPLPLQLHSITFFIGQVDGKEIYITIPVFAQCAFNIKNSRSIRGCRHFDSPCFQRRQNHSYSRGKTAPGGTDFLLPFHAHAASPFPCGERFLLRSQYPLQKP